MRAIIKGKDYNYSISGILNITYVNGRLILVGYEGNQIYDPSSLESGNICIVPDDEYPEV